MDYKICFRRVVALLLCCLLAVYTPIIPVAHATDPVTASLTVAGAGLSTGGLEGAALLSAVGPPAAAIIGITLGTIGVGTYVSKASAEAGMTPTQFVMNKVGVYCMAADIQKEKFLNRILTGCSVAADGAIALSNDAAKAIQQFGNWLFTQGSDTIVPEIPTSSGTSVSLGGLSYPVGTFFADYSVQGATTFRELGFTNSNDVGIACLASPNSNGTYTYCYLAFSTVANQYSNLNTTFSWASSYQHKQLSAFRNGYYYVAATAFLSTPSYSLPTNVPIFYHSQSGLFNAFIDSLPSNPVWNPSDAVPDQDLFTGTPEAWAENKDLLNPSAEDDTPAAVLNPDVLNPIIQQLEGVGQWQMDITDYLKALEKAWDKSITGIGDDIATIIDTLTGIKKEIAIPDDATKTADLTKPDVVPDDTTPIVVPTDVVPDEAIQGISFELDEVFPFCLPFDVYKMLGLLSADPVAPRYHVHYEGPYNIVIDFTVDLSAWDDVAAICRNMELLLFCVGLAVATRSIFIRA